MNFFGTEPETQEYFSEGGSLSNKIFNEIEGDSRTDSGTDSGIDRVARLREFLNNAPTRWDPEQPIQRFPLSNNEFLSCILWNGLFFLTGTDIVKLMVYRFECYGRPVKNFKKFEEGIFSDLRNLKPGIDAILEEPRSEFLEMLYRSNCIRTQKKQKVFFWYSVPHDRLFLDAIERDLKRESAGAESTTEESTTEELINLPPFEYKAEEKRHPLCHGGIPRRVDNYLIQDLASLTPGNNNHALQIQQRQLLMETKGLAYNFNMDYNYPTGIFPNNNFFSCSSHHPFPTNGFFQTPPLSDDLSSLHEMVSPVMDLRNGFGTFDPQLMAMSPNLPENFLTSPSMRSNYTFHPKTFHPYAMPPKMHSNDDSRLNERPHVCQVKYCGRAFKRSDQLRRHHKTHEHPYPCPFAKCPRSFNRNDQLQQHMALHHPDSQNKQPPKEDLESNNNPLLTNLFGLDKDNQIDDLQLAALAHAMDFNNQFNTENQPTQDSIQDNNNNFYFPITTDPSLIIN